MLLLNSCVTLAEPPTMNIANVGTNLFKGTMLEGFGRTEKANIVGLELRKSHIL